MLLSARPDWTPLQVREAIMMTASRAIHPDNDFGWGIVDLNKAIDFLPAQSVVIDHKPLKDQNKLCNLIAWWQKFVRNEGSILSQLFVDWRQSGFSTFHESDFPAYC